MGWRASENAIDVANLLAGNDDTASAPGIDEWLTRARPDVVFETTSLNPETGQPAIEHLRKSLQFGAHAITANKGPIVYAYDELNEIAVAQGKRLMFESTVLDSAPVFSLFRETLPAVQDSRLQRRLQLDHKCDSGNDGRRQKLRRRREDCAGTRRCGN